MRVYNVLLEVCSLWRFLALVVLSLTMVTTFFIICVYSGSILAMIVALFVSLVFVVCVNDGLDDFYGRRNSISNLRKLLNISFYHVVRCDDLHFRNKTEAAEIWIREQGIYYYSTVSTRHNGYYFCFRSPDAAMAFKLGYL